MKEITTGARAADAAGALTGELDTSTLTDDAFEIVVELSGLTADQQARVAIEDTASADGFSADASPVAIAHFAGSIDKTAPVQRVFSHHDVPTLRAGAAHNKLRATILSLTAGAAVQVQATLQGAD